MQVEKQEIEQISVIEGQFAASEISPIPTTPPLQQKIIQLAIFSVLIFCPFAFGAVHESVYLPLCALIFFGLCAVFITGRGAVLSLQDYPASTLSLGALGAFLCYCTLQSLFLSLLSAEHPIQGLSSQLLDASGTTRGLLVLAASVALCFLVTTLFQAQGSLVSFFLKVIKWTSFGVALVGLSHWYYDNGKLFWYFEPQNVFVSERARWPFVNANHLGTFLLPAFFLFLSALYSQLQEISNSAAKKGRIKIGPALSQIASSSKGQTRLVRVFVNGAALLTITITIIATLSRGTWAGLAVGIAFWYWGALHTSKSNDEVPLRESPSRSGRRKRKSRGDDFQSALSALRRINRPLVAAFLALLLVFFLNERGRELLVNRLDFGLMHSKDDIRWQMYQDSLPLFTEHPLFGVGYRAWAENYTKVMDEKLAGTNPVYLHSDPLQILIETGLVGITPLILLSFYLLLRAARCARKLLQTNNYLAGARVLGLSSGLLAALIGSCFDFPFRMGAISFYFAALIGALAFYLDKRQST